MSTAQRKEIARLHQRVQELERENKQLKTQLRRHGVAPASVQRAQTLAALDALLGRADLPPIGARAR